MNINSITDARTFVNNSGVSDWEFGGTASADRFAEWLYRNRDDVSREDYDADLREYLISENENPQDYGL